MTQYIVFDKKGIIYEGPEESEARQEFVDTNPTTFGDVYLAEVLEVRR